MQQKIEAALAELTPNFLVIDDESYMHSIGENSHFKLVIVSDQFVGQRKVQRHQRVYALLGEIMQQIHGLALHAYTQEEWDAVMAAPESPECQGGGLLDL